jgi:hypothetical protein
VKQSVVDMFCDLQRDRILSTAANALPARPVAFPACCRALPACSCRSTAYFARCFLGDCVSTDVARCFLADRFSTDLALADRGATDVTDRSAAVTRAEAPALGCCSARTLDEGGERCLSGAAGEVSWQVEATRRRMGDSTAPEWWRPHSDQVRDAAQDPQPDAREEQRRTQRQRRWRTEGQEAENLAS